MVKTPPLAPPRKRGGGQESYLQICDFIEFSFGNKTMSETKPRDVQILPIGTDTIILRSRSWARLRFEIEYALARFPGTIKK